MTLSNSIVACELERMLPVQRESHQHEKCKKLTFEP